MTDFDEFIALYKRVGKTPDVWDTEREGVVFKCIGMMADEDGFEGYTMFHTIIKFDAEGKFINQGFWE